MAHLFVPVVDQEQHPLMPTTPSDLLHPEIAKAISPKDYLNQPEEVVTAVLTGSAAGLLATIAAGHSAVAGFVTGGVVSIAVLVALMWFQYSAFAQAHQLRLFENEQERPDTG